MMRIIFMGTPEFAVPSLDAIAKAFNVVAVVTAPDKPAGRGLQMKPSAVKSHALSLGIPVLQPLKLKDPEFIESLHALHADIQVVVAFRMLPEIVWNMPPLGTWNLHASLLPQYRGAAPINHAIMNGEKATGVSTFKLIHAIDQGEVALQQKLEIGEDETAGELHDRMMDAGANLLLETLKSIEENKMGLKPQEELISTSLREAPKLSSETAKIDWNKSAIEIHNQVRGLSPYPGATTNLIQEGTRVSLKILKTGLSTPEFEREKAGKIRVEGKQHIYVCTGKGWIEVLELQISGKKRLTIKEFLPGFRPTFADFME